MVFVVRHASCPEVQATGVSLEYWSVSLVHLGACHLYIFKIILFSLVGGFSLSTDGAPAYRHVGHAILSRGNLVLSRGNILSQAGCSGHRQEATIRHGWRMVGEW